MNQDIEKICNYLMAVLNFKDYIEIPESEKDYFYISNDEMASGIIDDIDNRYELLGKWQKAQRQKGNEESEEEDREVEVLLIPKLVSDVVCRPNTIRSQNSDNNRDIELAYKKVSLMYLKAKCNIREKTLSCINGESLIWADPVIRPSDTNLLRHAFKKLMGMLFNRRNRNDIRFELKPSTSLYYDGGEWNVYISKVAEIFRRRTGKEFFAADMLKDEYGTEHSLYDYDRQGKTIVLKDDTVFAKHNILKLLLNIKDSRNRLPLLTTMLLGKEDKKTVFDHKTGIELNHHLGQMKNEYPLADAQRATLHSNIKIKDGEVLAVSGPPGTGKTTMLQSIVADMLVRTTIDGKNKNKNKNKNENENERKDKTRQDLGSHPL